MRRICGLVLILLLSLPTAVALADPCVLEDNGSGTVDLPPEGCGYLSPTDVHELIDAANLPPGTTIEFDISHQNFVCSQGSGGPTGYGGSCSVVVDPETCEGPGPVVGTVVECFESEAIISLNGTGALAAYSEQLTVPLFTEVLSLRGPGDPTPLFGTEMLQLSGGLPLGSSPTFCQLSILGGTDNTGPPNIGQVSLTPVGGGQFQVDSFFDVSYFMTYSGCPGSILDGLSGVSDLQTVTVEAEALPSVPVTGPLAVFALVCSLAGGRQLIRREGR
jgi:hypothetical protein